MFVPYLQFLVLGFLGMLAATRLLGSKRVFSEAELACTVVGAVLTTLVMVIEIDLAEGTIKRRPGMHFLCLRLRQKRRRPKAPPPAPVGDPDEIEVKEEEMPLLEVDPRNDSNL